MQRRRVESVSVTNEGRLVGVLTTTDVLRLLHDRIAPVP
jgi:CBS domain-containing protein